MKRRGGDDGGRASEEKKESAGTGNKEKKGKKADRPYDNVSGILLLVIFLYCDTNPGKTWKERSEKTERKGPGPGPEKDKGGSCGGD